MAMFSDQKMSLEQFDCGGGRSCFEFYVIATFDRGSYVDTAPAVSVGG